MLRAVRRNLSHADRWLVYVRPVADIVARLYVARVFFLSGLSKVQDWQTTLFLFRHEYHVPLLSPHLAAIAGSAGELGFSVLLAVGLFTPLSALGLFFVNIVAFVSYYHVLIKLPAAWHDHLEWGIILALLMSAKSGLISVDRLLDRYLGKS